jgi:excisionase family DNA binding protein
MSGQASNVVAFPAARQGERERWLTPLEIAEYLGVSRRWVYNRIGEGMPSRKLGALRRLRLSEVEAWLREKGWAA